MNAELANTRFQKWKINRAGPVIVDVIIPDQTSDRIRKMLAFAKQHEPDGGYFGPESLVDQLAADAEALKEFKSLFANATADELDALDDDDDDYGWIVSGAADELDLFPDDPRLFKTDKQIAKLLDHEILGELYSACIVNDVNAVRKLAARINVNTLNHNKQSALYYAVGNNHSECVQVLLANGADPNLIQNWGNTPMHICATSVSSESIWKMLLASGGDPDLENNEGQTASMQLRSMGRAGWSA